jgi:hypothetical protein
MTGGQRLDGTQPSLKVIRRHAKQSLAELPQRVTGLAPAERPYQVTVSDKLKRTAAALERRLRAEA